MLIFPAIDLKDGRVVRLYKGDFGTVHQVAEDPVSTAKAFRAAGARYLHMVDLDGVSGFEGRVIFALMIFPSLSKRIKRGIPVII